MKIFRTFLFAIVATVGIPSVALNAQNSAANSFQSTKSIEQKAYSKLRGLTRYGVFDNIDIEVTGSTVVLTGR